MDYDTAGYLAESIGAQIAMNQPEQPTLRDQFAMAALTGFLANSYADGHSQPMCTAPADVFAGWAYSQADAMLAAREKQHGQT